MFAPPATAIRFSPWASTMMSATPVASPGRVTTPVTSTPSASSVARASAPKPSSPIAPMNQVGAPRRAAATAWFAPLPPWCLAWRPPITVSPGPGNRSTVTTRSTLIEPTTMTRPLTARPTSP